MSLHNKAKTSSGITEFKNKSRKIDFKNSKNFLIQVNNFTIFFNFRFFEITIVMSTVMSTIKSSNITRIKNNKNSSLIHGKNHQETTHLIVLETTASKKADFNSSTAKYKYSSL